ncbi:uncharacterized protein BX664DRAFT_345500 [Halteromyces radiatus]|uniref:uncharacterized protein n=1 Tax=Halteromyces radiatus TaxID=101107 RepID=UPI00221EF931|nr:uncharacterized protein BX664DRAFT_345500 [Halteromyces radiatus]KAI8099431.1 hypothetical protein BX664DRAFT_345500 [Halteromyces radiatus]
MLGVTNAVETLKPQFIFTFDQYKQLQFATIICGSLSLLAGILVLLVYCYMVYIQPRDANRVSLHCVIASIMLSMLEHVLNIASLYTNYNAQFCKAFRYLDGILPLITPCLLGMVGVHFLLVFYFHVHTWPCRPEYILIPSAVIYAIIGNIYSFVYDNSPHEFHTLFFPLAHQCWYYTNFIDRLFNPVIAMLTLYRDNKKNHAHLAKIANHNRDEQLSLSSTSSHTSSRRKTNRLPCFVNIWGFGLQMHLQNPDHLANFGISMMDTVLIRLEGVFIALIFFSDPTVGSIVKKIFHLVDELLAFGTAISKPYTIELGQSQESALKRYQNTHILNITLKPLYLLLDITKSFLTSLKWSR